MNVAACPEHLDILSICTGGGGLDLGIGLAIPGARSVCLVEREAFAVARLVSAMEQGLLHPAPVWSDARTFDGRRWRGCVDGLIGGIPCQPHSLAGRKRGSLDERDLWSDARRIIVQSRCWFVLIENVAGMLAAGADEVAGAERVWRDLRKLGFKVEIGLFTAAEVGASHERERVFILGVADAEDHAGWSEFEEGEPQCGWSVPSGDGGEFHHGFHGGCSNADAGAITNGRGSTSRTARGTIDVMAAADGAGPQRWWPGDSALGRQGPQRHAGLGGRELVDATVDGRGEGRTEPELRSGGYTATGAGEPVVHAECSQWRPDAIGGYQLNRYDGGRHQATGRAGEPSPAVVDAERFGGERRRNPGNMECTRGISEGEARQRQRRGQAPDHPVTGGFNFPPGPGDIDGWRAVLERAPELEPAFRRVADGLASGLDNTRQWGRVDRLRMLGNGVVPLQAAYALRTLATRLAGRGSAGAARLVRLMEAEG